MDTQAWEIKFQVGGRVEATTSNPAGDLQEVMARRKPPENS